MRLCLCITRNQLLELFKTRIPKLQKSGIIKILVLWCSDPYCIDFNFVFILLQEDSHWDVKHNQSPRGFASPAAPSQPKQVNIKCGIKTGLYQVWYQNRLIPSLVSDDTSKFNQLSSTYYPYFVNRDQSN